MRFNLGDKITINGTVFTVYDEGSQVKSTLNDIVSEGKANMAKAVEEVISRHEGEIKKIENQKKAEKESALMSIARTGSCYGGLHSIRMGALLGSGNSSLIG